MRSYDSLRNFSQIGTVGNVQKGKQTFIDERPLAGRSYYKVTVVFRSGLNWSSNHCSIHHEGSKDTTVRPIANGGVSFPMVRFKVQIPEIDLDAIYTEPIHVRYNRTTGHLDVRLPTDYGAHYWSLTFYDRKNQPVLSIPVIKARIIVIDKRNFRARGIYKFVLREDDLVFEWGYIGVN